MLLSESAAEQTYSGPTFDNKKLAKELGKPLPKQKRIAQSNLHVHSDLSKDFLFFFDDN